MTITDIFLIVAMLVAALFFLSVIGGLCAALAYQVFVKCTQRKPRSYRVPKNPPF